MHGVINPLFEENFELSDLVEPDVNDDEVSYYCEKSVCPSSVCDSEYVNDVAFDNEVFDQVVVDDQLACISKFYDDYSHVIANPLYDYEDISEDFGVV